MWLPPHRELDDHPATRSNTVAVPIPCVNGQITISVEKAESQPLAVDVGSRWEITYTLELDEMSRTETLGYASTYDDAVDAVRSYLDTVRSARTDTDQMDALEVKSQLDAFSPPGSEMIPSSRPL